MENWKIKRKRDFHLLAKHFKTRKMQIWIPECQIHLKMHFSPRIRREFLCLSLPPHPRVKYKFAREFRKKKGIFLYMRFRSPSELV